MLRNLFSTKNTNKQGNLIEYRKVITTNAGMYGIWDIPAFSHISDYDEWEMELLEDQDIEKHIDLGVFAPIYIRSDGVADVLIRVGTESVIAILTERESKYKYVSSNEYLLDTHGELGLSGIEFIGNTIDEDIGVLQVNQGKYAATIHLISWDDEPNMRKEDGTAKEEALPDFVVLINPTHEDRVFRKTVETFETPKSDISGSEYQRFLQIKGMYSDYEPALKEAIAPTNSDFLQEVVEQFNCNYPQAFIDFQLSYAYEIPMGDFAFEGFGWANRSLPPYMNLHEIVKDARKIGVPEIYAPFKVDNGDYYCFSGETVVIWDHNSNGLESDQNYVWSDFLEWLEKSFDDDNEYA
tara:strand:+ start:260 stop:1318 length:1059 start_codon:yes stop_codon:yes gene_type:complete